MQSGYRILFVCGGSHVAGLEIVNLTLMKQLKEYGYSVFCLASGWNDGEFVKRLEKMGIPYECVKLGNLYISRPAWTIASLLNLPNAIFRIKKILKKNRPDIVILNDWRNFLYTRFLWKDFRLIYWEQNLPAITQFNRRAFKSIYNQSFAIIACSDFVRKRLQTLTGGLDKIKTIHNSIEVPKNEISLTPRHPDKTVRVGIVGQIIPRKGHLLLVDALVILCNRGLNCILHIYGNGATPYADEVRHAVKEKGLTGRVFWNGFVRDKNQIYGNIDIVVVPSTDEPFGLVAIEPAAWGLPVVAARSGGLPEIVCEDLNGLLFEQGNSKELAACLETLIIHPDVRSKLGEQARNHLYQHFTSVQMASRFIGIFTDPTYFKILK